MSKNVVKRTVTHGDLTFTEASDGDVQIARDFSEMIEVYSGSEGLWLSKAEVALFVAWVQEGESRP